MTDPTTTDNASALTGLSLREAAARIADASVSPVELVTAHLDRIAELNPTLNAFITIDRERAIDEARRQGEHPPTDRRAKPLRGVPISVKDNIPVAGMPMTQGCRAYADYVPDRDNGVVARLREAGAIVVGKTNMHECACGGTTDNAHYGPARNPWDLGRSPAGSSGGCAVAVSSDMVAASFGTDAGGSVRFPAAVTGLVGLRPTLGVLPTDGMLSFSTDTIGPLTHTVDDSQFLFGLLTGTGTTETATGEPPARDLTVATIAGLTWENTSHDVRAALERARDAFADASAGVGEISVDGLEHLVPAIDVLLAAETTAQHRQRVRTNPGGYSDEVRQIINSGELIGAADYLQAQKYRRMLRANVLAAMRDFDILLLASQPFTALPFGQEEVEVRPGERASRAYLMLRCSALPALAGLPALSVPVGLDSRGLPIGLQLVGRPHGEHTLFAAARVIEQRLPSPFSTSRAVAHSGSAGRDA
jgi:aspartyl-tRNA(Asn)/glutamyl-tRNA(Gln) amidotransferase subunit A